MTAALQPHKTFQPGSHQTLQRALTQAPPTPRGCTEEPHLDAGWLLLPSSPERLPSQCFARRKKGTMGGEGWS